MEEGEKGVVRYHKHAQASDEKAHHAERFNENVLSVPEHHDRVWVSDMADGAEPFEPVEERDRASRAYA